MCSTGYYITQKVAPPDWWCRSDYRGKGNKHFSSILSIGLLVHCIFYEAQLSCIASSAIFNIQTSTILGYNYECRRSCIIPILLDIRGDWLGIIFFPL
jgi:hypothetical protein